MWPELKSAEWLLCVFLRAAGSKRTQELPEAHLQVKQRPELLTGATLVGSSIIGGHSRFLYSKDWELSGFPFMCL